MTRIIFGLVVIGCMFFTCNENSTAQDFETNVGSVSFSEGGTIAKRQYYNEQHVTFSGPKINYIIKFGKRKIELLGGKVPSDFERAMNRAASPSEEQKNQLSINNMAYIASLRAAFLAELNATDKRIDQAARSRLRTKFATLREAKQKADHGIWLPHQLMLQKQYQLNMEFVHKPLSSFHESAIAKELGLTKKQIAAIKKISDDLETAIKQGREKVKKKVEAEIEARNTRAVDVLRPHQKQEFTKMLGDDSD